MKNLVVAVIAVLAGCKNSAENQAPPIVANAVGTVTTAAAPTPTPPLPDLASLRAAYLTGLAKVDCSTVTTFDQKNAPLGMNIDEFKRRATKCRISKHSGAPVIDSLVGHDPAFPDIFPVVRGVHLGCGWYYNHTVPGLERRLITAYELKCSREEPADLVVLDATKEILLVRKLLFMKEGGAREQFDEARSALKMACTGVLGPVHEATWQGHDGEHLPAYITYCDQGPVRIVLGSSTWLASVYQPRPLGVTYIDRVGWDKYIAQSRATIETTEADKSALKSAF